MRNRKTGPDLLRETFQGGLLDVRALWEAECWFQQHFEVEGLTH